MRYSDEFGFFELNPFPGSNQIVVSNHAFIYPEHRGKGLGSKKHRERLELAASLGYDLILCTVRDTNAKQRAILRNNGWTIYVGFLSTETEHGVELWGRRLLGMNRARDGKRD